MSQMKKFIGRINNTDRRCVVVYHTIPGNEENALVVDTDALPDRYHDALLRLVETNEAQQSEELWMILSRRMFADYNQDMLNVLHAKGYLRPVSIDNVTMYPYPNTPCPLRDIVTHLRAAKMDQASAKVEIENLQNRILENQKVDATEGQLGLARGLLTQAADLEAVANQKREEAYRIAPDLRPVVNIPTPVESLNQVEVAPTESSGRPDVTGALANAVETIAAEGQISPARAHGVEETFHSTPYTQIENVGSIEHHSLLEVSVDSGMTEEEVSTLSNKLINTLDTNEVIRILQESVDTTPFDHMINEGYIIDDFDEVEESSRDGNQVDISDDALQAFLDRAAYREDLANKEALAALQPKKPVGRPRKDGLPAGTKPEDVPKKRGRPPGAKNKKKNKAKSSKTVSS